MKKFKFPTAQTILIVIALLVAILTWFIPAGKYDSLKYNAANNTFEISSTTETETIPATQERLAQLNIQIPLEKFTSGAIYKPINIPNTYTQLTANPQGFSEFVQAPIKGIIEASDIIFLVLIIGGLIGIMNHTGAFDAGIASLAKTLNGREYILIIVVTTLVAIGGTTFGLSEETMAFYPILIPVFLAAKYDALVGLASIFIGSAVGCLFSITNPFATIIASDAAGISWTTGMMGRSVMLLLCLIVCIVYILQYAKKVKKDPTKSLIYDQKEEMNAAFGLKTEKLLVLSPRLKFILIVFSLSFVVMIIGVSFLDWWFIEMTSTFLVAAILIGIIGRIKEHQFVEAFAKGAGELLSVAFIIGIARGVTTLMNDGLISDTVLYYASTATEGMNKGVFANLLMFIYSGLAFFIPSQSGMAVLTMPIMSPLADTVGVGREVVVNSYLYGIGLFYFINPTSMILAALSVVKIGYNKWLKFVWPLLLILTVLSMLSLTVSVYL
ncbi:YfcC family protein [Cellulophaga sp. L1A9]|uniref:YfcC family protein n=1 Tax=Cellulophaga sp. L1A9 TaxID=2686362 RepID=UPI00131C4B94|nr:YfcC family protein [Cellulophaga sp. L1A9]